MSSSAFIVVIDVFSSSTSEGGVEFAGTSHSCVMGLSFAEGRECAVAEWAGADDTNKARKQESKKSNRRGGIVRPSIRVSVCPSAYWISEPDACAHADFVHVDIHRLS